MEPRSCTHSGFEKFTAVHTWVMKDFSLYRQANTIDGAIFFTTDEKHEWRLTVHPGYRGKVYVLLTAVCSDSPIAKAKLWIVDENKQERNVQTLDPVRFKGKERRLFGPIVSRNDLFDVSNGLLPDDTLTLCCEVTLLVHTLYPGPEISPYPILQQDFGRLLTEESFSDVTLVVGEKEFHVHRAVLAARSPVFRAMFQDDTKERREGRVVIEDLSPEVVEGMLRYIYTNFVEGPVTVGHLAAAVKYDLEGLKSQCEECIWKCVSTDTAVDMFRLADKYGLADLKECIGDYIDKEAEYVFGTKGWKQFIRNDPDLAESLFCSRCKQFKKNANLE